MAIIGIKRVAITRIPRDFAEHDDRSFKIGDIVSSCGERLVLHEIINLRWSCPPSTGGIADLKFWGMHPNVDAVTRGLLDERDLKNDIFGSFTKDLNYPDNEMETLAISAQ